MAFLDVYQSDSLSLSLSLSLCVCVCISCIFVFGGWGLGFDLIIAFLSILLRTGDPLKQVRTIDQIVFTVVSMHL